MLYLLLPDDYLLSGDLDCFVALTPEDGFSVTRLPNVTECKRPAIGNQLLAH
jgi:hypothetical protein